MLGLKQGNTDRAQETHKPLSETTDAQKILVATSGLLRLKEGNTEDARQLYLAAARLVSQKGHRELADTVRQKMHLEFARYFLSQGDGAAAVLEVERGLKSGEGRRSYRLELERLRESLRK
jgi:hypothetical protein